MTGEVDCAVWGGITGGRTGKEERRSGWERWGVNLRLDSV